MNEQQANGESPRHDEYITLHLESIDAEDVANLPPDALVLPRDEDKLAQARDGQTIYSVGTENRTPRPLTDAEKAAYRDYYVRQGRELLPWMLPKAAGA